MDSSKNQDVVLVMQASADAVVTRASDKEEVK